VTPLDFRGADLRGRDFRGMDLGFANFTGARLAAADFRGATLTGAVLSSADLAQSIGITATHDTPFEIEAQQDGVLVGYKLVRERDRAGVFYPSLFYRDGAVVRAPRVTADSDSLCGEGVNVATLAWCQQRLREHESAANPHQDAWTIVRVLFERADLVVIPRKSEGKYRVAQVFVSGRAA
jgi:hypothetical protein